MNRVGVTCQIKVYEIDDEESIGDVEMYAHSHWNERDKVLLQVGDGHEYTVVGEDLITAIRNCMSTGGF